MGATMAERQHWNSTNFLRTMRNSLHLHYCTALIRPLLLTLVHFPIFILFIRAVVLLTCPSIYLLNDDAVEPPPTTRRQITRIPVEYLSSAIALQ